MAGNVCKKYNGTVVDLEEIKSFKRLCLKINLFFIKKQFKNSPIIILWSLQLKSPVRYTINNIKAYVMCKRAVQKNPATKINKTEDISTINVSSIIGWVVLGIVLLVIAALCVYKPTRVSKVFL